MSDLKLVHRAGSVSAVGVSAYCYEKPHAIKMDRETWTLRDEAVTCPKCIAKLAKEASSP